MIKKIILLTIALLAISQNSFCDQASIDLNENGVKAMQSGQTLAAEKLFKQALSADTFNITAAYNLSAALVTNKKDQEAKELLLKYSKENPKDLLLKVRLGDVFFSLRDLEKSKDNYEAVLKKDNSYTKLYAKLGTIYALLENPKKAELYFDKAVSHNQKNARLVSSLASIQLANGKTQKAIQSSKRAIQLSPQSKTYITLGKAYETTGKKDQALISYKLAKDLGDKSEALENKIKSLSKS